MGKLKALRMGITKGVAHNPIVDRATNRLLAHYRCARAGCGHSLALHDKDRPEWAGETDQKKVSQAIITYNPMGFDYCAVTYCSECEAATVRRASEMRLLAHCVETERYRHG